MNLWMLAEGRYGVALVTYCSTYGAALITHWSTDVKQLPTIVNNCIMSVAPLSFMVKISDECCLSGVMCRRLVTLSCDSSLVPTIV